MKDIIFKADESLTIRLHFIVKREFKLTHVGKSWPKHTQCLMYSNDLLKCFKTIVKHEKDEDNQAFAYKVVGEKCLRHIPGKWLRSEVRKLLDSALANENKLKL